MLVRSYDDNSHFGVLLETCFDDELSRDFLSKGWDYIGNKNDAFTMISYLRDFIASKSPKHAAQARIAERLFNLLFSSDAGNVPSFSCVSEFAHYLSLKAADDVTEIVGGFDSLTAALVAKLKPGTVRTNARVTRVQQLQQQQPQTEQKQQQQQQPSPSFAGVRVYYEDGGKTFHKQRFTGLTTSFAAELNHQQQRCDGSGCEGKGSAASAAAAATSSSSLSSSSSTDAAAVLTGGASSSTAHLPGILFFRNKISIGRTVPTADLGVFGSHTTTSTMTHTHTHICTHMYKNLQAFRFCRPAPLPLLGKAERVSSTVILRW